jgi:hypothetical protein
MTSDIYGINSIGVASATLDCRVSTHGGYHGGYHGDDAHDGYVQGGLGDHP